MLSLEGGMGSRRKFFMPVQERPLEDLSADAAAVQHSRSLLYKINRDWDKLCESRLAESTLDPQIFDARAPVVTAAAQVRPATIASTSAITCPRLFPGQPVMLLSCAATFATPENGSCMRHAAGFTAHSILCHMQGAVPPPAELLLAMPAAQHPHARGELPLPPPRRLNTTLTAEQESMRAEMLSEMHAPDAGVVSFDAPDAAAAPDAPAVPTYGAYDSDDDEDERAPADVRSAAASRCGSFNKLCRLSPKHCALFARGAFARPTVHPWVLSESYTDNFVGVFVAAHRMTCS